MPEVTVALPVQNSAVVMVVPGSATAVLLDPGATVRQALDAADVTSEGMQIRIAGNVVNLDTPVTNGDRIILTRQIKGN